jgi:ribosomal protein L24
VKRERQESDYGKTGNHNIFLPYRQGIHVEGLKKIQKNKKNQGNEENGQRVELQIIIERIWLIQDFKHGPDLVERQN